MSYLPELFTKDYERMICKCSLVFRNYLISTYAKFSKKLTFLTLDTCAYQGIGNVSFSEIFAYVLNEQCLSGNREG